MTLKQALTRVGWTAVQAAAAVVLAIAGAYLSGDIDWDRVAAFAVGSGAVPVVALVHRLAGHFLAQLPEPGEG